MDNKDLKTRPDIEQKPLDELGALDDQFEDLLFAATRAHEQTQRFALVVDATSSMGHVWAKAKDALTTAVDKIKTRSLVPVQICVVAYRDHIDDPKAYVVQASEWSDDTEYLHGYIRDMRCHGGGDYPESIGHGLSFVLRQQQQVHQIILIGDAPSKAGSYGYAEAKSFGAAGCPIYALHTDEDPRLVECFTKLAKLSGGKAFYLDRSADLSDIFSVLLASNKVLGITYQPETVGGAKMAAEVSK